MVILPKSALFSLLTECKVDNGRHDKFVDNRTDDEEKIDANWTNPTRAENEKKKTNKKKKKKKNLHRKG